MDMKLELVDQGLRHQYVPDHDALRQCRELGQRVGQAVKASGVQTQAALCRCSPGS